MARVHLFTSSTPPYNYKSGPENNIAQEPLLLSEDIIDNTTIAEQPLDIGTSCFISPSSPSLSSTALTAALLQNASGNNDAVGSIALPKQGMKLKTTLIFSYTYIYII